MFAWIYFSLLFFTTHLLAQNSCPQALFLQKIHQDKKFRNAEMELARKLQKLRKSPLKPHLIEQGFSLAYYAGVDLIREFSAVHEYLKQIEADAELTHIPYFADQVSKIIAVFEKEFIEQNKEDIEFLEERLKVLETFKRNALIRIENKEVTYDWWLTFNTALAVIGTKDKLTLSQYIWISGLYESEENINQYFKTYESFKEALSKHGRAELTHFGRLNRIKSNFPEEVIFFTSEDLGIMALNRMINKSYVFEVTGKKKFADSVLAEPITYYLHDIGHINGVQYMNRYYNEQTIRDVIRKLNSISNLTDRKKAEIAVFWFLHEGKLGTYINSLSSELNIDLSKGTGTARVKIDQALEIESQKNGSISVKKRKKRVLRDAMRIYLLNIEFNRFLRFHDAGQLLPAHLQNAKSKKVYRFLEETIDIFMEHFSDIFIR